VIRGHKKGRTTIFSPLSFVAIFGSGMDKNQGPGSGMNIRIRNTAFNDWPDICVTTVSIASYGDFAFTSCSNDLQDFELVP
jgi:hypothetical protein